MNKIYKVVWSKAKHCYVVASELAKRTSKGSGARSLTRAAVTLGVVAGLTVGMSGSAWAALGPGTAATGDAVKVITYDDDGDLTGLMTEGKVESNNNGFVSGGKVYNAISDNVKSISVNGKVISYTTVAGTTKTIETQDTTYTAGNGIKISGTDNAIEVKVADASLKVDDAGVAVKVADASLKVVDTGVAVQLDDTETATGGSHLQVKTNGLSVKVDGAVGEDDTGIVTGGTVFKAVTDGSLNLYGNTLSSKGDITTKPDGEESATFTVTAITGAVNAAKGNFTVDKEGNTVAAGKLEVAKESNLKGNVTIGTADAKANLDVKGATTTNGITNTGDVKTDTLTTTGNASVGGDLGVTGKTTTKGITNTGEVKTDTLITTGNASVGGDFDVTGATALKNTLTVDGKTTLKDTLSVTKGGAEITGNTIVRGGNFSVHAEGGDQPTFEVTASDGSVSAADGNFTVKGDGSIAVAKDKFTVDASGNTSAAGTLDVTDATTLGDTLTVEGDAELKSNLKVGGEALFNEGKTNQIKIDETGIRIGLHSGQIDPEGFYAGGHTWDEAKAAIGADGRIKGEAFMVNNKTYIDKDGLNANNQKIRNVAPGDISPTSTDATIGRQLYEVREELQADINRVGAGAAAMANLRPLDMGNKFSMAMGVGSYRSKTAMAMGLFYKPSDRVAFNVSGTVGNGHNMIGAGVSFALDKVVKPVGGAAAQAEIQNLKAENAEIKAELAELKAMIASMKAAK